MYYFIKKRGGGFNPMELRRCEKLNIKNQEITLPEMVADGG
jgi:hypothetical protein